MLQPVLSKNDRLFKTLIISVSVVVFIVVAVLGRVKLDIETGFDVRIFARINAVINSAVSVLLIGGLIAVRRRLFNLHRKIMLSALVLSVFFLVSYICHHLLAGDTSYGGTGGIRYVYFFILITHIFLAAIILPFILFTSYRALIAEWPQHRKLARITWPIWLYVSVTGVVVYLMISPYYQSV